MAQKEKVRTSDREKYKNEYYGDEFDFLLFVIKQPETSLETKRHLVNRMDLKGKLSGVSSDVLVEFMEFSDDELKKTMADIIGGRTMETKYAITILTYSSDYHKSRVAALATKEWLYMAFSENDAERLLLKQILRIIVETPETPDAYKKTARAVLKQGLNAGGQ